MKSIPDTEEIPEFTKKVERAIQNTKHKAKGMHGITSDFIKLEGGGGGGGRVVLTYITSIFNNILKTKQIPDSWHEAKILFLFLKRDILPSLKH